MARNENGEKSPQESVPAKPYPGRPPYFGPSHLKPPTRPTNQSSQSRNLNPQCPVGENAFFAVLDILIFDWNFLQKSLVN